MFNLRNLLSACFCLALLAFGMTDATADPGDAPALSTTTRWIDGWNAHDAATLGNLMTPDVDFVLVSGMLLHGRQDFVHWHAQLFAGRYAKSVFKQDGKADFSLIQPDVALIHWRWSISGVDNPDGSPAPVYRGIFTWVLVRTDGNWLIRAAQNTIGQ
ncbi:MULTISPECIES: SgcJ/EcaC family oxidoreductase [Paraburkholderia]|uniref:DUF4440 domain-containing protein n=1 Tax=Paraburkholderia largidicola TaxID=3014751 RepID=A0A7I8C0Z0_9BURK|nr:MULTISPECIES: SgcJ/EcaC family oxidoreductase [Paraburkholderia]BCF94179.1 hypothetical protein PPGU16_72460 [Paraburkholderia sp. PGU16]GJH33906.1 SgcJ/EcaC family oxidoreductase [Paraburkholderia hospita]CAG9261115.1 exported hypothetical protein [Paraburkholderia caribensis]